MPEPDWNDFKVILGLASGGSIAGAARALGVDGSTVSRRLAALEESLGARLIVRGGQRFEWTAEDLAKGEAHIALRMFKPTEPSLIHRRTFEIGWAVYASLGYLAEHGHPATPGDLRHHKLVRYVSTMQKVAGPRWLEEHCGAAVNSVQVDNAEMVAHVLATGAGIGVVPCPVVEGRSELVRVFPEPVAYTTGFIVYHESVRDTACVRGAVDALSEMFEENSRLFTGRA